LIQEVLVGRLRKIEAGQELATGPWTVDRCSAGSAGEGPARPVDWGRCSHRKVNIAMETNIVQTKRNGS
jgi:hypothetical protein